MLLSAVSVLVVAQSSSEIPEGLMNNPVFASCWSSFTILKQYVVVEDRMQHRRDHMMYAYLHNDTNGRFSDFTDTLLS